MTRRLSAGRRRQQIGRRLLRNGKSGGALTAIGHTEKKGARYSARSVGTVDDEIIFACPKRAHAVLAGDGPMDTMVGTVTVIAEETAPRINRVSSPGNSTMNAVFAWLEIQSKAIRFQVDSGASFNILRQEDLDGVPNQAEILPTSRVLRMYDTSTCTPIGTCTLSVRNPKPEHPTIWSSWWYVKLQWLC